MISSTSHLRIALSGKSGSGKSELAEYLVKKLNVQRCSTGDIYRQLSLLLFGEVRKDLMNRLTTALRATEPNCVLRAALSQMDVSKGIVFDSMRFQEDHSYFMSLGFMLVRIKCDASVRFERLVNRGEVHSAADFQELERDKTETELDDQRHDLILTNNLELPEFLYHAKALITGQVVSA